MSEFLGLQETAQYISGKPRIPEVVLLDLLGENNNEFKVLAQAPLIEGVPISVMEDIKSLFPDPKDETAIQTISFAQINSNLSDMWDELVRVQPSEAGNVAIQTEAGHFLSAPLAGHLGHLSLMGNVSLRNLIGEKIPAREDRHGVLGRSAIETRRILLTDLWEHTREEGWMHTGDLVRLAEDRGARPKQASSHLKGLIDGGIVERRNPNRKLKSEKYHKGKMVRLKPENGLMAPSEIVERYLSIILLTSVVDVDFLADGLDKLNKISSDSKAVPYLIKRSFASGGHAGKSTKHKTA